MAVFGIQDQEVIIKPYFKCTKISLKIIYYLIKISLMIIYNMIKWFFKLGIVICIISKY